MYKLKNTRVLFIYNPNLEYHQWSHDEYFEGKWHRECTLCRWLLVLSLDYFNKDKNAPKDMRVFCKKCERKNKSAKKRGFDDWKQEWNFNRDFNKSRKSYFNREGISDHHIKKMLKNENVPNDLIHAKRVSILINRITNLDENGKQEAAENLKYLRVAR